MINRLSILAASPALDISTAHAATSPDPGDYTALPPGTNLLLLYGIHNTADTLKVNGNTAVDNPGLKLDLGLLRYVHYSDWHGHPSIGRSCSFSGSRKWI